MDTTYTTNQMYIKEFHFDPEYDEVGNITNFTDEDLVNFIAEHQLLKDRYQQLDNMYMGRHEILDTEKPEPKPNNKLVANHAKYIVDTYNGFFMGEPVKTTSSNERVNAYIQEIERTNSIDDHNSDLSKGCSNYGHNFELIFADEEANLGIVTTTPKETFIIYDNAINQKRLFGIRYRTNDDDIIEGTTSDNKKIRYFNIKDSEVTWLDDYEQEHYFEEAPIIEYIENEERLGTFEPVETLINAYNKALSEKANDVDYFADAYLKVIGMWLDEEEIQRLRDERIINIAFTDELGEPVKDAPNIDVSFLEKPNADTTQENLLAKLEQLIYTISMVINVNDDTFGNNSGEALKYKLMNLSNLANTKERKFTKSFDERYKLIGNFAQKQKSLPAEEFRQLSYKFTRNTPSNLKEEAEIARSLQGITSDRLILDKVLSIVENVDKEMQAIEEEDSFNTPMPYEFNKEYEEIEVAEEDE